MIQLLLSAATLRRALLCSGVALALVLSGCAWTKTPVNITLTPGINQLLDASAKSTLRIGEIKDERFASDPRVVWQKANAYGKTTGAYVAQVPMAELLREALEKALLRNEFKVATNGAVYELGMRIQESRQETIQMGLISSKATVALSVRFELLEAATGKSVWRDTFIGRSEDKLGMSVVAFVERNFKAAAEDVLRQLIVDKSFRQNFL